jgi:pilus assembly protein CpaE
MARILIIDDNADLLQMMGMLLKERGGHEVVLSTQGEDGLAKAAANPPDLAIVDVMMPGMTGYEVCRQLRERPATADIPLIVLTARGQDVDRQAALEAGADMYLAKPVTMAELLERVNGLLARRPAPQPDAARVGHVLSLLSLRGGVGVTTLAVNLASLLRSQGENACVVDLCPSSGNVALQLGLRPQPNWSVLMEQDGSPTETQVEQLLLSHSSGLRVLAAPFVPITGDALSRRTAGALLHTLREEFAWVVVDLPSVLNEATLAAVEAADVLSLVVTADPATVQATVGVLQALRMHSDKMQLILNQILPGTQPPLKALERVVRRSFAGAIPFDGRQAQALAQSQPLAFRAPDSPLAQAVAEWAPVLQAQAAG